MNYPKSQEILEEINKAKRILVNLHRGPDPDSVASALSLYYFLCSLNKDVHLVVTENSPLNVDLKVFDIENVTEEVNFLKFDFNKFDLFITPDSGSWQQIVDSPDIKIPDIPIVVIDHHESNDKFGKINLVESSATSCAEVIYKLFQDWDYHIDTATARLLLLGIVGDSGGFAFSENPETLRIAAALMEKGANKTEIINNLFRTKRFEILKYWAECLERLEIDREHKFIWTAIPYDIDKKYGHPSSNFASTFLSMVEGTDFGIIMTEDEKDVIKISLRARNPKLDVAKLAEKLGGGGHKMAAGAMISGLPFEKAVEKVLETARSMYAEEN